MTAAGRSPSPVGSPPPGRVERLSRLAPRVLLMLVRLARPGPRDGEHRLLVDHAGHRAELGVTSLELPRPDGDRGRPLWLCTATVPDDLPDKPFAHLLAGDPDNPKRLAPARLDELWCEPTALAEQVRGLDDGDELVRAEEFVATTAVRHGLALRHELAASLTAVRDVLRTSLPAPARGPTRASARLASVTRIDERTFWLSGWVRHEEPQRVELTAVSPEGARCPISSGAVTFSPWTTRPQGGATLPTAGYHALAILEQSSANVEGWLMEFRWNDGTAFELACEESIGTDAEGLIKYLRPVLKADQPDLALFEGLVAPALQGRRAALTTAQLEDVVTLGESPAASDTSVVIAVTQSYRMQHQLAQFVRDPELAGVELVFVAHAEELRDLAHELYELYGLPFRLGILTGPATHARALEVGAQIAGGRLLALMSSDVLPAGAGWLGRLRTFHDELRASGAVGPKLVHEDDSIAQAGIDFERLDGPAPWQRRLRLAGMARDLPEAAQARQVHAVSDACLIVQADRFWAAGGFGPSYEDNYDQGPDLCLALADQGLESWYCPEAELYLMDQADRVRQPPAGQDRFNAWLFGRRHDDQLERLVVRAPASRPAIPAFAPAIPGTGSGRGGAPIEQLRLISAEPEERVLLVGTLAIQQNEVMGNAPLFSGTYAFALGGLALPRVAGAATIEVRDPESRVIARASADLPSPPLADEHPDHAQAGSARFHCVISSLSLPVTFELRVDAVDADGGRAHLGVVRGRRRPVRGAYRPAIQPLLLTTNGRSGSNWLITLLGNHPDLMTFRPFVYEPMVVGYWASALRTFAEPLSYMQSLLPEITEPGWWTGQGRKTPLPLHRPAPEMARWLGSENVEVIAGFCQSRVDAFYTELARVEQRALPRYFVEKCAVNASRLAAELYPDGRELVLVRDFRDRMCSIRQYNLKRGFRLWGAELAESNDEWLSYLRDDARQLLAQWRARQDRIHLVRYEDLVLETIPTLTKVFTYLGVDASAEVVEDVLARSTQTLPGHQEAHRTAPSVAASVGRWREELAPEELPAVAEAFDDLLVEFGYEPTLPAPAAAVDPTPAA